MSGPADEVRARIVSDAIKAAEGPASERARVAWRNGFQLMPVVLLRADQVLLNPRSHRIRAQLESHPQIELVESEPYGERAQAIIEGLLRETEGFEDLRANLKDAAQREYGIVTHVGLLVNANRRCVALRDNGVDYIRVAVLPSDAQQKEIDGLELRLQLQEDFREEYSFSNQLLFVEDLLQTYGYSDERVALDMNWGSPSNPASVKEGVKNVQKHVRMLAAMRQLQHLSGGRLPLTWLDDKQQAMIDLDAELEKHGKKDDATANLVRNNRLLGMLANVFYRDLREVDANFLDRYLQPYLETKDTFTGRIEQLFERPASETTALKGLDAFEAVSPTSQIGKLDAEPLVTKLAASHGQSKVRWKSPEGDDVDEDRNLILADLLEAMGEAADDARVDRKAGSAQERPRRLLEQAAKAIRRAGDAYLEVRDLSDFKHGQFDAARTELDQALATLDEFIAQRAE